MSYPHYPLECGEHHDVVRDFRGERPYIVTLCGSTQFADEFNHQRKQLTLSGYIVLSIEIVTTQFIESNSQYGNPEVLKGALGELHKRKIDLCDWVYVLNVNGYIGASTRDEIEYANTIGTPVHYLNKGN